MWSYHILYVLKPRKENPAGVYLYFLELTLKMTVLNAMNRNSTHSHAYTMPLKYLEFLGSEFESYDPWKGRPTIIFCWGSLFLFQVQHTSIFSCSLSSHVSISWNNLRQLYVEPNYKGEAGLQ